MPPIYWVVGTRADFLRAVVARFRPPNKAELASGGDHIVDFETEDTCSINVRSTPPLMSKTTPTV